MRITNIALDKSGDPETVTAELSRHELVFLGSLLGRMNGTQYADVMPRGDHVGTGIYDAVDDLFNRFYDGGIEDVS